MIPPSFVNFVAFMYDRDKVHIRAQERMAMSQILSLRIPDRMAERLERFARRQGNGMTRNKAGILLLEEGDMIAFGTPDRLS